MDVGIVRAAVRKHFVRFVYFVSFYASGLSRVPFSDPPGGTHGKNQQKRM